MVSVTTSPRVRCVQTSARPGHKPGQRRSRPTARDNYGPVLAIMERSATVKLNRREHARVGVTILSRIEAEMPETATVEPTWCRLY